MTHYISVSEDAGTMGKTALRVPLYDAVEHFPDIARLNKLDNTLLFGGYFDVPDSYSRLEGQEYMKMNVVFIDCDNGKDGQPLTWDKDIIKKFKADMEKYQYVIWETYSSTTERPKFRALIPLDATLNYTKDVKQAVFQVFRDYADPRASWFFAPDTKHLPTVYHKADGELFPSCHIKRLADEIARTRRMFEAEIERRCSMRKVFNLDAEHNPEGWRHLPTVKKCLEGLAKGERDNSLNAACYAMTKNNYKDKIPQFLDEVDCELALKNKFRRQYR